MLDYVPLEYRDSKPQLVEAEIRACKDAGVTFREG
jgi:hypothetical protein